MSASLLLILILVSSSSGYDLSSFLGLPQLRSTTPAPPPPKVVEIVRYRQPICLAPGSEQLPPCVFPITKYLGEFPQVSINGQEIKYDVPKKTRLNTAELRDNISIEEIDPSSILQPTDEIRAKNDATPTPALEVAIDINVGRSGRSFFDGGRANAVDASTPRPIFVTTVRNAAMPATLVAKNCWPDIGIPLCTNDEEPMKSLFSSDPTKIPLEPPMPSPTSFWLKALHELFFHRPGVSEYVANITGDAEKFHDKVKNNLTSTNGSALEAIHYAFMHRPRIDEFVVNVTTAIEKQAHENVDVEIMNPFKVIAELVKDVKKEMKDAEAREKQELAKAAAEKKAVVQGIVEKKHEVLRSFAEKKEAAVQGFVDKSSQVLETISNAAAEKKAVVQGVLKKKHEAIQGIVEKKQSALQAIVDKKNQLVEKKQGVIASITDSLSQKKDAVVQAITDKQAAIKGIVEKTQDAVQGFIDKKVALEMDIANRGQNLVQNIADKKQDLIQGIAEKKQSMLQHLADKKTDAIKAISDKTQEIIGTVSVMKPLLISSIQQNLGLGPKQTPIEDFDLETTTATATTVKDDKIVFEEETTDVEEVPLVDERSAADNSIVAENEAATTTENFYEVLAVGSEDASRRSARSRDDENKPSKFVRFSDLKKIAQLPGERGYRLFFKNVKKEDDATTRKPSESSSSILGRLFAEALQLFINSGLNITATNAQAEPTVTEFDDPFTSNQGAPEATTALPDNITGTEHDFVDTEEDETVVDEPLNSSTARPVQSLSLPGFTEENEEEPDTNQLQVVDDAFAPISKEPLTEVSVAPTSTTEDDAEPTVIDYEPTTASTETKTIVLNTDSNERPVVVTDTAQPDESENGFVIAEDLEFVDDNKANRTEGV